jgi:hypothetical protein
MTHFSHIHRKFCGDCCTHTKYETYQLDKSHNSTDMRTKVRISAALRAVMELHKPSTHKHGLVFCNANCEGDYPCPTIQAIEGQLR